MREERDGDGGGGSSKKTRERERETKEDRSTRRKMEREMVARELNKSEN